MIHIVMGLPGGGKSMKLAEVAWADQRRGKTVLSNFPIRGCRKVTVDDLRDAEFEPGTTILIDEAGAIFNSADWEKLPLGVFILFSQSRHLNLDLWVAVQRPMRLAKPLRELGNYFWWCEKAWLGLAFRRYIYFDVDDLGKKGEGVEMDREFKLKRARYCNMYDSWDTSLIGNRIRREFPEWDMPEVVQGAPFWRRWLSGVLRVVGDVKLSRFNGGDPAGSSEPAGGATVHS